MSTLTRYSPPYYPHQQTQFVYVYGIMAMEAGTCVANTLTAIKEVHHYMEFRESVKFSNAWVFGNRVSYDYSGDSGMLYLGALEKLQSDGVPIVSDFDTVPFYNFYFLGQEREGALSFVNRNYSSLINQARANRISSFTEYYTHTNSNSIPTIKTSIISDGCAMLTMVTYNAFYRAPSNGIIPDITYTNGSWDYGEGGIGHSLIMLGWTTINGEEYWLCQNSWGSSWGENGRCYIKMTNPAVGYIYTIMDAPNPPKSSAPANFKMTATKATEIYFKWDAVSGATKYEVGIYAPISESANREVSNSTALYWGELKPNTTYYAYVRAYVPSTGWTSWSDYAFVKTPVGQVVSTPKNLRIIPTSSTEIYGTWDSVPLAVRYEFSITSQTRQTTINNSYIGNLSPNTYYYGKVRAMSTDNIWSDWSPLFTVKTLITRPSNFSWTYAKNSGGTFNISATEWTALCTRINNFREYKGLSAYGFTSAVPGQPFTAAHYNEARNAINSMNTNIPAYRSANDIIYASDIDKLRTTLNSIT